MNVRLKFKTVLIAIKNGDLEDGEHISKRNDECVAYIRAPVDVVAFSPLAPPPDSIEEET